VIEDKFTHFGELYRAAYAEPESGKKLLLLTEVQRAIREWERTQGAVEQPRLPSSGPKSAASERRSSWFHVA
jgi:hypothetical protein